MSVRKIFSLLPRKIVIVNDSLTDLFVDFLHEKQKTENRKQKSKTNAYLSMKTSLQKISQQQYLLSIVGSSMRNDRGNRGPTE